MIDKARLRAIFVSLVMVSIAAPAIAAPTPEAAAEAARLDALATKLGQSGATREALAALRQSQALVPKRTTLEKIAALQRKSNDFAGAYATYTEILTTYDGELKPKDRADIKRAQDELRAITGGLHLKVAEAGARVEIDGAAAGEGPLDKTIRVGLGAHAIKVSKPHFESFEWKGDVGAGADVEIVADLHATQGALVVRVRGAPAEVWIDGRDVGPSPRRLALPPGRHVVEVGEPGKNRREVDVVPGEEAEIEIAGETGGRLAVTADAPEASIKIDGAARGTGRWEDRVDAGPHEIEIAAPGYETVLLHVTVRPQATTTESVHLVRLKPPPSFVGLYGMVSTNFTGSPSLHNFVTDECAANPKACTGGSGGLGAAIPLRLGYSFGYLGVEGVTQVRYDQVAVTQQSSPIAGSIDWLIYRVTVSNGVEVRYMPKFQSVRPFAALGLGWSHEIIAVATTVHQGHKFPRPSADGDAPIFFFDAGMLVGSTPGTRFRIALEGTVEPTGEGIHDDTQPTLALARGAVFFLGPSLGMQFGH